MSRSPPWHTVIFMRPCTHNCLVYHYRPSSAPHNMLKIYCLIAQILITVTHLLVPVLQFPPSKTKRWNRMGFWVCLKLRIVHFIRSVLFFQQTFFLSWDREGERVNQWECDSERVEKAVGLWGWWEYSSYCMFQVCWLTNIRFFPSLSLLLRGICSVCLFRQTLGLRPWWKWTGSGTSCFGSVCHRDRH